MKNENRDWYPGAFQKFASSLALARGATTLDAVPIWLDERSGIEAGGLPLPGLPAMQKSETHPQYSVDAVYNIA